MDWKQLGKAAKRAAASIEDAARKAAPHIEEAAAKAAAHIEEAAAKAKPHLEDAARKTRAAAKEVGKRIDRAEPGRDAVKRLLGGVLKDWLDGDIAWIDEDNAGAEAEAKPAGASIAVSLRKGEIELRRMKLKARSLDAVGAPGLYLVAGSVDHAKFVLPWARLGAKPVKAEIRGVALRVRATADDDVITTAVEGSAAERRRELDLLEAVRAHWTALASQQTDDNTQQMSLGRRLLAKLASKVSVDINDVSVSFGDAKASATHVWARDDERASPRRVVGAVVGISLAVGERVVLGPIDADATADARCLMPNQRPPPEGFPLVEPPKKGRAAWVVRLRCDALRVDGPIVSTEEVLNALDAVRIAATRVALRDFPAPKPVATNAKAWWRRAYAYALRECRKGREDRWANAMRLLRMHIWMCSLEPFVVDKIERERSPVVIVSHLSTLQVLHFRNPVINVLGGHVKMYELYKYAMIHMMQICHVYRSYISTLWAHRPTCPSGSSTFLAAASSNWYSHPCLCVGASTHTHTTNTYPPPLSRTHTGPASLRLRGTTLFIPPGGRCQAKRLSRARTGPTCHGTYGFALGRVSACVACV